MKFFITLEPITTYTAKYFNTTYTNIHIAQKKIFTHTRPDEKKSSLLYIYFNFLASEDLRLNPSVLLAHTYTYLKQFNGFTLL